MSYLGQVYNPPDYYQSMITDPTQVPVQMYPGGGGGGAYGYPGGNVFGPYPGFYLGSRILEPSDAIRLAKERQIKMMRRAEVTDNPAHKYLTPTGRLNPKSAAVYKKAKKFATKEAEVADPAAKLQKKILTTVLLGAVVSALLR